MLKSATRFLVSAAMLTAPLGGAFAHRQWMLPSTTIVSGTDSWVTVDLAASNDLFYADHQPGRVESIKVWQPDGSEGAIQNAARGRYRSVFDVKLDKPGTWKIGNENSGIAGTFKVDGVEWRLGGRRGPPPAPGAAGAPPSPANLPGGRTPPPSVETVAEIPANAADVKLTETISRNEIFVTVGEPTTTVLKPTGRGLEFDPVTHPDELVAGEPAKFRFLVDGKPAAGVKLTVVMGGKRYRNAEGAVDYTTGADGVATINWPEAGMYWFNATFSDAKSTTPRVTQRRLSYIATVEVMTP